MGRSVLGRRKTARIAEQIGRRDLVKIMRRGGSNHYSTLCFADGSTLGMDRLGNIHSHPSRWGSLYVGPCCPRLVDAFREAKRKGQIEDLRYRVRQGRCLCAFRSDHSYVNPSSSVAD